MIMSMLSSSVRFSLSAHARVARKFHFDMSPTKKIPAPVELDIDENDGYTLSADGELSPSESFMLPGPTPQTDSSRTGRFHLKSRPPPARKVSQAMKSPSIGSISPSCSGFRFPDLPSPMSPKQDFKELVTAVKKRQEKRTKSSLYQGVRHPSRLASPARKPAQLHVDIATASPIIKLQLPLSRPLFKTKNAKAGAPTPKAVEAASPSRPVAKSVSPVAITPIKTPATSSITTPVKFPATPLTAIKLSPLITTPTKGNSSPAPCTPPNHTRFPMATGTRLPSNPVTPVTYQTRSPCSPPSSNSAAAKRAAALARWEQFRAAHAMQQLVMV